jgi:hypothetical protein
MYYDDQLGCGNSDIPNDPSLWTLERYKEEVEEVRRGPGLDDFVLYEQSWGGILVPEYALKHHCQTYQQWSTWFPSARCFIPLTHVASRALQPGGTRPAGCRPKVGVSNSFHVSEFVSSAQA